MKATVVAIEASGEYSDGRRRVVLKLVRAPGGPDFGYDRIRLSERELAIAGLRLDDVVDIEFRCEIARPKVAQ